MPVLFAKISYNWKIGPSRRHCDPVPAVFANLQPKSDSQTVN